MVHEAMVLETSGGTSRGSSSAPGCGWPCCSGSSPTSSCRGASRRAGPASGVLVGVRRRRGQGPRARGRARRGEVGLAKLRLFRVPELLAGSFVLAFLAVTASYLVA